jgi:nondiscriminating aspartyl-tRNA synthetase
VAPVFRAEKHNTSRHINEYTSMDLEFGPIKTFEEVMNLEEEFLMFMMRFLQKHYLNEIELLKIKLPEIFKIPRIKFLEAKKLLKEHFQLNEEDDDLSPGEELKLCEYIFKNFNSEFVFVTHYPEKKRPFYAMNSETEIDMTESFDLLFRGIEITTGGMRIHKYDEIIQKMKKRNMDTTSFKFFTDAHLYGLPPHGGFGMGLERLTQKIVGLNNVKEATMFPRDISRLTP